MQSPAIALARNGVGRGAMRGTSTSGQRSVKNRATSTEHATHLRPRTTSLRHECSRLGVGRVHEKDRLQVYGIEG